MNLESNIFDPGLVGIVVDFFTVAGKYAIIFGILFYVMRMLIRAFTGKETFL